MISEAVDSKFPLRMTQTERTTVEEVQADATEAGIKDVSLNDVIRHLIRRTMMPDVTNEFHARRAIHEHWASCSTCDPLEMPRCLDGLYVQRTYARLARVGRTA